MSEVTDTNGETNQPDVINDPLLAGDPVSEAPVAEDQIQQEQQTETPSFDPTGDPGLDLALDYLAGLGFGPDSVEILEAVKGNYSYLEAKLGAMPDKAPGWERYLALAKAGAERIKGQAEAEYKARREVVLEAVGGEEAWTAIQAFVNETATEQEKDEVRAALSQGGMAAKAMALLLKQQYDASAGTTVTPAAVATRRSTAGSSEAALTREGYLAELNALVQKVGATRVDSSPEYAKLRAKYANVR